jgi:hypothetical protein
MTGLDWGAAPNAEIAAAQNKLDMLAKIPGSHLLCKLQAA